jgi:microcystin-dependent protein
LFTLLITQKGYKMSDPYIGQVYLTGWNFASRSFALCEGQLQPISQNTALFSLLGTTFGGDGRTSFGLPDLRGRLPMGQGNGPGLSSRRWGQKGGVETVTLNTTQMPSHTHTVTSTLKAEGRNGNLDTPAGNMLAPHTGAYRAQVAVEDVTMNAAAVTSTAGNAGGNQAHENMQPYLVMYYQIALFGVFPSRS